ncbi:MAG: guanylate kinase [Caldisericia bacterium]|nr:guanylate kinase [Caldisericia bacterium]
MKNATFLVVSGPSGVGKKTVITEFLSRTDNVILSVSATTRKPRRNEKNGIDYWFFSHEEFHDKIQQNLFIEWALVGEHYYGTPWSNVEIAKKENKWLLLEIDVQGGLNIMNRFPEDVISIFIVPPTFEDLHTRLQHRGTELEEEIQKRLEIAKVELLYKNQYDFTVENDTPENAAKKMIQILSEEPLCKKKEKSL